MAIHVLCTSFVLYKSNFLQLRWFEACVMKITYRFIKVGSVLGIKCFKIWNNLSSSLLNLSAKYTNGHMTINVFFLIDSLFYIVSMMIPMFFLSSILISNVFLIWFLLFRCLYCIFHYVLIFFHYVLIFFHYSLFLSLFFGFILISFFFFD